MLKFVVGTSKILVKLKRKVLACMFLSLSAIHIVQCNLVFIISETDSKKVRNACLKLFLIFYLAHHSGYFLIITHVNNQFLSQDTSVLHFILFFLL